MKLNEIYLEEMPKIVEPTNFGLDDRKTNHAFAKKMLKDKRKKIIKSFDDDHILYEIGQKIILINKQRQEINYVVQYDIKTFSALKQDAIQQIKVFRLKGSEYIDGLAKDIFFNKLLPKYGLMITDALQTEDGERFWFDRIRDALNLNLFVYYVDLVNKKENFRILDTNTLRDKEDEIWGHSADFKSKRVIILDKELKI